MNEPLRAAIELIRAAGLDVVPQGTARADLLDFIDSVRELCAQAETGTLRPEQAGIMKVVLAELVTSARRTQRQAARAKES
jgi:hypothetical protein